MHVQKCMLAKSFFPRKYTQGDTVIRQIFFVESFFFQNSYIVSDICMYVYVFMYVRKYVIRMYMYIYYIYIHI